MAGRRAKILASGLAGLWALLCGSEAMARAEPQHVALVIGNVHYAPKPGIEVGKDDLKLGELPNACADTELVASSLIQNADWADADITTKCDLDAGGMLGQVRKFVAKMRSPGSVGLIYFSGHGIQVGDHNYLFGVGAHPNAATEVREYLTNPDAPLFPGEAIDLHADIVSQVGNVTNGALLIVVDACRDNPLAARITEALNKMGTSGYRIEVSAPSSSTKTVPGIKIAYSTSSGDTASDGLGASSPYAEAFSGHIVSGKQIVNILSETETAVYNDTKRRFPTHPQDPSETGHFAEPPTWCFAECPNEEGTGKSAAAIPLSSPSPILRVGFDPAGEGAANTSPKAPSSLIVHNEIIPPDQIVLPARKKTRHPRVSFLNVDIYWCLGGHEEDERHKAASSLGKKIASNNFLKRFRTPSWGV